MIINDEEIQLSLVFDIKDVHFFYKRGFPSRRDEISETTYEDNLK